MSNVSRGCPLGRMNEERIKEAKESPEFSEAKKEEVVAKAEAKKEEVSQEGVTPVGTTEQKEELKVKSKKTTMVLTID